MRVGQVDEFEHLGAAEPCELHGLHREVTR
jgi:hypothetical protein